MCERFCLLTNSFSLLPWAKIPQRLPSLIIQIKLICCKINFGSSKLRGLQILRFMQAILGNPLVCITRRADFGNQFYPIVRPRCCWGYCDSWPHKGPALRIGTICPRCKDVYLGIGCPFTAVYYIWEVCHPCRHHGVTPKRFNHNTGLFARTQSFWLPV